MTNDFPRDIKRRGVDAIPTHKYVQYGTLYYAAFDAFVQRFLDVYYPDDTALLQDVEVQNWAAACAKVPHLRGFPSTFKTKTDLKTVLTHVIFQSTLKHHTMNGASTWHAAAIPYAITALWAPLPTRKMKPGEKLDLMAYTVPKDLVSEQVRVSAMFHRFLPVSQTLLDVYRNVSFSSEPALLPAMQAFESELLQIDTMLLLQEGNTTQPWPSHLYRPGMLSFYTWV